MELEAIGDLKAVVEKKEEEEARAKRTDNRLSPRSTPTMARAGTCLVRYS